MRWPVCMWTVRIRNKPSISGIQEFSISDAEFEASLPNVVPGLVLGILSTLQPLARGVLKSQFLRIVLAAVQILPNIGPSASVFIAPQPSISQRQQLFRGLFWQLSA